MMSILRDTKKQINDFRKLTSDVNRWKWVFEINKLQIECNHKQTLKVILDNNQTLLVFDDIADYCKFDESIGQMMGIISLLDAHRVNSEFA